MSILKNISKGKVERPHFVLLYGVDGVGKTTFAAQAPDVLFLGVENGTANLDVSRASGIKTYEELLQYVSALSNEKHDYKSVAIDSLDWIEPLLFDYVCRQSGAKRIEEAFGGYGKGYAEASKIWGDLIRSFEGLREKKGLNVILIAHSQIKAFNDPNQPTAYERYQLKLNDKNAAIVREAVDSVLFATFETFVKKDSNNKTKAFGDGKRVMFTERRPAFDAKNRFGLPFELPLSFEEYVQAIKSSNSDRPSQIKNEISELLKEIKDKEIVKKVELAVSAVGTNEVQLLNILEKVKGL